MGTIGNSVTDSSGFNNSSSNANISMWNSYKQGEPLPEPICVFYSIGDLSTQGSESYKDALKSDSKGYTVDEDIPFTSKIFLAPELYGEWECKKTTGFRVKCMGCNHIFPSQDMYETHQAIYGCVWNYVFGYEYDELFDAWSWIPDPAPCKVIYSYTIPEGLSFKKDSVRVEHHINGVINSSNYSIKFSGQNLTVTIDDIKSEPFYKINRYMHGISVTFNTKMNDNILVDNVASASITYSYKGAEKNIDLGETVIHTASIKIDSTDQDGNSVKGAKFDLYQNRVYYPEGSSIGSAKYVKVAENISAGDVILGIGEGRNRMENEFKLVQTKTPDGHEKAYDKNFTLSINSGSGKTTVSAEDDFENQLPVNGNVVTVSVVNKKDSEKDDSKNASASKDTNTAQNEPQKTDIGGAANAPMTNISTSTGKKLIKVRATYYKDGERESSMTFQQTVDSTETMMDKKEIWDRAYVFKGYKLQKITLNGVEVDSLPAKVEDKSEVCFYYVTE